MGLSAFNMSKLHPQARTPGEDACATLCPWPCEQPPASHFVFAALINSVARNPASQAQVQPFAFLGFALAEATGLFGLAIAFLILFVF